MVLVSDPRRNIKLDNSSLILYSVTRAASGNYSCEAFNNEGTGTSGFVPLRVQCEYSDRARLYSRWREIAVVNL